MIDKNKAYRFRGDSERWVWDGDRIWRGFWNGGLRIDEATGNHLHERGILLEYPELPGEDWEFCDEKCGEAVWDEAREWVNRSYVTNCEDGIYCRKKKPVITEVEGEVMLYGSSSCTHITCPIGDWLKPGDRVKVTKL